MSLVPKYPRIRLLSPTRRRIAFVHPGSDTSEQLHHLGWRLYTGPAQVYTTHKGPGKTDSPFNPALDPRNGFIIPGTDPALTPIARPAGSLDHNPYAVDIG